MSRSSILMTIDFDSMCVDTVIFPYTKWGIIYEFCSESLFHQQWNQNVVKDYLKFWSAISPWGYFKRIDFFLKNQKQMHSSSSLQNPSKPKYESLYFQNFCLENSKP